MTEPTVDALDALPTDELRHRAFELAEHRHDVGFFWDVARHLPRTADAATEDGSSGSIGAAIADVAGIVRGLFGGHGAEASYGAAEPLLRARFITYLQEHGSRQG